MKTVAEEFLLATMSTLQSGMINEADKPPIRSHNCYNDIYSWSQTHASPYKVKVERQAVPEDEKIPQRDPPAHRATHGVVTAPKEYRESMLLNNMGYRIVAAQTSTA